MFCKILDRKQSCPARVENFDQQRRQSFDTGGRKHSLTLPFTSYFFRPKGIQLKFAMVGAPAVGKSALLVKFLTGRFIGEYIKGYFLNDIYLITLSIVIILVSQSCSG